MSTENEPSSVAKPKCRNCGQEVPIYCGTCHQPYIDIEKDPKRCKTCCQIIPGMIAGEQLDGQIQMKGNNEFDEFETQKDGTHRVICTCCKRKLQQCPACEIYYDSEEDRKTRKRKSSNDDTNSEESSEDDEDSIAEHPRQKLRSLQKRIRKNEEVVTDDEEEESDDEEEEGDG